MTTLGAITWCGMAVVTVLSLVSWRRQLRVCEQRHGWHHPGYEGDHKWGPWSRPYTVGSPAFAWWQERTCQCGNRDFRPAPKGTR